jgi:hypothetical protein
MRTSTFSDRRGHHDYRSNVCIRRSSADERCYLLRNRGRFLVKTPGNPGGLPLSVFDGIRVRMQADRSQCFVAAIKGVVRA